MKWTWLLVPLLVAFALTACRSDSYDAKTCGPVTYPETQTVGVLTIDKGTLSCTDAKAVIDRFLSDPKRAGNTGAVEFDGWLCSSPTAAASEAEGYSSICNRGSADQVTIRPAAPSPATSGECDADALNRELAGTFEYKIVRCYGNWAFVDTGGLGDAQSLARRIDGTWTIYAAFPTSTCSSKAKADGVPDKELGSFPAC